MRQLIQAIESVRQKLPMWRRRAFKETPTRTIVIDPFLEALGWNVRDPDEVQLEYPTVDGKSVDYALMLNKKPVLLVEAKALGDTLDDVKCVTQVVGYAANDGIVWCVLTNGVKWRVYRSVEECPAPDKLMFEVNIAPGASEEMNVEQIAKQMWRFSREEMAKGTLDTLGEQTFTDGKVSKALQNLMVDPPRPLVNLIRNKIGDGGLTPQRIKDSLARIAQEPGAGDGAIVSASTSGPGASKPRTKAPVRASDSGGTSTGAGAGARSLFDEAYHIHDRPQETISLYRMMDRLCLSIEPSGVQKVHKKMTINYMGTSKYSLSTCRNTSTVVSGAYSMTF